MCEKRKRRTSVKAVKSPDHAVISSQIMSTHHECTAHTDAGVTTHDREPETPFFTASSLPRCLSSFCHTSGCGSRPGRRENERGRRRTDRHDRSRQADRAGTRQAASPVIPFLRLPVANRSYDHPRNLVTFAFAFASTPASPSTSLPRIIRLE